MKNNKNKVRSAILRRRKRNDAGMFLIVLIEIMVEIINLRYNNESQE